MSSGSKPADWTRREFVRGAAGVLALPSLRHAEAGRSRRQVAYIACGPDGNGAEGSIWVWSSHARALLQRVSSPAPAKLLHVPATRMLYAANDVKMYEGLPRGVVEAFRIHPADGTLTSIGRVPLSLSAIEPRNLALSPDGKWLAVAAYGGGIYNLLPVAADGSLGAPRGIFKEAGSGADTVLQTSAHPHTLFFDRSGMHLLTSDFGADRLSVFAVQDGRLMRKSQRMTGAGTGPAASVLHPAGFLYVSHHLEKTLGCYRFDASAGEITERSHELALGGSTVSLALHPAGRRLYATDEQSGTLKVWRVDTQSGKLTPLQKLSLGPARPSQLTVADNGKSVFILDSRGSMVQCVAHPLTGELFAAESMAAISAARCMAVETI